MPSPTIDPNQIATIVNAVLVIVAVIGVPVLAIVARKGKKVLADVKDIIDNAVQASNDGKLTAAEVENIVNDIKDLVSTGEDIIKATQPAVPGAASSQPTNVATSTTT